MTKIVFVSSDQTRTEIDAAHGVSIMQAAVSHGVDGIVAECGGSAMCATCHVYIDEHDQEHLPPISEIENEMLDSTVCERLPASRLSCQLPVTPEIDGIVVRLPERQL